MKKRNLFNELVEGLDSLKAERVGVRSKMPTYSMSVNENYASFTDQDTGKTVFVDSFDNHEFEVRYGTIEESASLGRIQAGSDAELNRKLQELLQSSKSAAAN